VVLSIDPYNFQINRIIEFTPSAWLAEINRRNPVDRATLKTPQEPRFNSESHGFLGLNCAKSRRNFYDAETLFPFRICDMRIGSASAIRINLVQPGCNRSVLVP
jgi:hypothetical protein